MYWVEIMLKRCGLWIEPVGNKQHISLLIDKVVDR
jgi:hypothetical protein